MQSRHARIHATCAEASSDRHSSMQRSHASTHARQDDELETVDSDMVLASLSELRLGKSREDGTVLDGGVARAGVNETCDRVTQIT